MKLSKHNELIEDGRTVKGRWQISPQHEVQYKKTGLDEEMKVRGSLVAAEPHTLLIALTERQSDQTSVARIAKLTGTWRANSKNQLVFEVEKEGGKNDILTFKAGWRVNSRNEIVYTYERVNLKTKKKESRQLSFDGFWDISEKNRLTYFIGGDPESAFRFRGAFQTKSILARKGEIRYQLGIEVAGKHGPQTIILFGRWKISHDLSLGFEIETERGQRVIVFDGEYALGEDSSVQVKLKSKQGNSLGLELTLTKDIFGKNGQAFIRLQKAIEESRVEAEMSFKW